MAKDPVTLKIVNENNKYSDQNLDDEIEKIFGKAPLPNTSQNGFLNNLKNEGIHLVSFLIVMYILLNEIIYC